jgi:hypothetical protein
MVHKDIPTYRFRNASNLLIVNKYPEWLQLALRCGWRADIRVSGQAIAVVGQHNRSVYIERGLVCGSTHLFQRTGQIRIVVKTGIFLNVYPDELWSHLVASFLLRPKTDNG